jgi:peptidyl-tRNA hydrolase, PTH1 family
MFLVAGLGNIGLEYQNTRHNVGFEMIDLLSKRYNIPVNREKYKGAYGEGFISGEKVILLKPYTYMNLSGESIRSVVDFYKLDLDKIIVIYDDVSLELGRLRIRQSGSAGGHNGIKSIIAQLGTESFPRIKIGIGQPKYDIVKYVLGTFPKEDKKVLEDVLSVASDALEIIIKQGINEAMNKYNGYSFSSE